VSASETDITVQDCLQGAFAALLRGDTTERDRLCAMASTAFDGAGSVPLDTPIKVQREYAGFRTAPLIIMLPALSGE
jgi:hypothetical protein